MALKTIAKRGLPGPLLRLIRRYQNRDFNNMTSNEQIFTQIYRGHYWGKEQDRPFYSGSGSARDEETVTYIEAVRDFLHSLPTKPDVVDLGCGDFSIGSQIRDGCGRYIACDVVPSLITFNKDKFDGLDVDFVALDLVEDELPLGDVALVRQVLQHLSNDQIRRFVSRASYRFLIVTEHLPLVERFKPNADKLTNHRTRMGDGSGVVLTSPPFNLRPRSERELCRVKSIDSGVLVTTLYAL